MRHYDWFRPLRQTYFKHPDTGRTTISGAVVFAYNFSVNEQTRQCTITGCFAIKSFATSQAGNWENCTSPTWATQDPWLQGYNKHNKHTWGTISIGSQVLSFDVVNYRGGACGSTDPLVGTGEIIDVDNIVNAGAWNGTYWYGGCWKFTDDISLTFTYGADETQPTATISVSHTSNTTWLNGWNSWSGSNTIIMPYIESSSLINYTSNYGASYSKNKRVYVTTNGGTNWNKANLYKTTNYGQTWTKVQ